MSGLRSAGGTLTVLYQAVEAVEAKSVCVCMPSGSRGTPPGVLAVGSNQGLGPGLASRPSVKSTPPRCPKTLPRGQRGRAAEGRERVGKPTPTLKSPLHTQTTSQ